MSCTGSKNNKASNNSQSSATPLEARHYSESFETTLNKNIDILYICLPDRSNAAQRSSSGLNNLGLSPDEEFDMYQEFAAAVDDWNTSMEDHTRIIFVLKEFYS